MAARHSDDSTKWLDQNVNVYVTDDPVVWISVGLHDITHHNSEVWNSRRRGTAYDEARSNPTPHFDCLVHRDAVFLRVHDGEFWLNPVLWDILVRLPGTRSGTLQKVGNDSPAWERPKVVLLGGAVANGADAAVLTSYIRNALGAGREATTALRGRRLGRATTPEATTGRRAEPRRGGDSAPRKRPAGDSTSTAKRGKGAVTATEVPSFKSMWKDPLNHGEMLQRFRRYAATAYITDSIDFLDAVRRYRDGASACGSDELLRRANDLYTRFVNDDLNVDHAVKRRAHDAIRVARRVDAHVFDAAETAVVDMVDSDKSRLFKQAVLAGRV